MRENLLNCRKIRHYKVSTTNSNHTLKKYPNLLKDDNYNNFPVIVGDVTYYDIRGKNHYLAHLMDLTNREVLGVAVSNRLDTDLVLKALKMAISKKSSLKNYIHHTDSDSRYCSSKYIQLLTESGFHISMCKGNAYENAHAESLNKTLKRQEINLQQYKTLEQSEQSILKFIDIYNNFRPHTACGGLSPIDFRKKDVVL